MSRPPSNRDRLTEWLQVEASDPWWKCERMQKVQAHRASDAAAVFADRLARRLYGSRTGSVGAVREDLRTQNGNWFRFQIFVGRRQARQYGGGISGRNEWIEIERIR